MSAYDLGLNLLIELRKRDKMRSLSSILSLFSNQFDEVNNTGARMLGSIYHMTFKLLLNCIFGVETHFLYLLRNVIMDLFA